jgi:hypothetical protein
VLVRKERDVRLPGGGAMVAAAKEKPQLCHYIAGKVCDLVQISLTLDGGVATDMPNAFLSVKTASSNRCMSVKVP